MFYIFTFWIGYWKFQTFLFSVIAFENYALWFSISYSIRFPLTFATFPFLSAPTTVLMAFIIFSLHVDFCAAISQTERVLCRGSNKR